MSSQDAAMLGLDEESSKNLRIETNATENPTEPLPKKPRQDGGPEQIPSLQIINIEDSDSETKPTNQTGVEQMEERRFIKSQDVNPSLRILEKEFNHKTPQDVKNEPGKGTSVGKESRVLQEKRFGTKQDRKHRATQARQNHSAEESTKESEDDILDFDPVFASLVNLYPVPFTEPLRKLTQAEVWELESMLQFGDASNPGDSWREDWSGNLQFVDKEIITNALAVKADPLATRPVYETFLEVDARRQNPYRGIKLLFSFIYHMKGTPKMAKRILAHAINRPARNNNERTEHILEGVRRISYDPHVLVQDGWTLTKSETAQGASGGAFMIGKKIIWEKYEAIIIAFVHDDELGDLWKAMWISDQDTFDLEAEEMWDALKKWESKQAKKRVRNNNITNAEAPAAKGHLRYHTYADFSVDGVEHGVVLAASSHQNARRGVMWPARVLHVSELEPSAGGKDTLTRRGAAKRNLAVVFLAPYWNGQYLKKSKGALGAAPTSIFSTGPLFEIEHVEPTEQVFKKYSYDEINNLSVDKVRTEFRFLGLPKAAFPRYLDAHRIAAALKRYGKNNFKKDSDDSDAFSALTDCHQMALKTTQFPHALLELPYEYILQQLPHPSEKISQMTSDDAEELKEPTLDLESILNAMSPPHCFGFEPKSTGNVCPPTTPYRKIHPVFLQSPEEKNPGFSVTNFASEYLLSAVGVIDADNVDGPDSKSRLTFLGQHLSSLVDSLNAETGDFSGPVENRRPRLAPLLNECLSTKAFGEEILSSMKSPTGFDKSTLLDEWRKTCERIYKRAVSSFSSPGFGNGVTTVLTDAKCNGHLTAQGCFERTVRIPAAIKGAKSAGAGCESIPLLCHVEEHFIELAEKKILPMAHKASYLKRIKSHILALPPDAKGAPLTDDSDGEGGEDTQGSRGSYLAALTGVACALQAVHSVVSGDSVTAFCAIRPPGHHAGRELRAMNAVSNGFCVLNNAACAALFAATAVAEGGKGLKRVCVIDFDVHHGNGTQDILCATYDPRFLYVSLHAGGAHINGYAPEGDDQAEIDFRRGLPGGGKQDGIYPGRCGDTSPHSGVLNIPLGQKVTPHAIGTALITEVQPAVEKFAPELIILSAGFDAHKNDPLGMGGLSAEDFGSVTEVACHMALKSCSGRVVSVMEGGYGVPCCQQAQKNFVPARYLDLGDEMPDGMKDDVTEELAKKLERCHQEGFLECVKEHVGALSRCSKRRK